MHETKRWAGLYTEGIPMRDTSTFKRYQDFIIRFKDIDRSISSGNDLRDLAHEIQNYIELHTRPLIEDVLYNQLLRNYRKEKIKKGKHYLYLATSDDIIDQITDKSFLSRLTQNITQNVNGYLLNVNKLDPQSLETNKIYSHEFTSDPYSYTRVVAYYYFDTNDKECKKMLRHIYAEQLVPKLQEIYNRSQVNKMVNIDRFSVCSVSDFEVENALSEISLKNIGNLIPKLNDIVSSGQKLLDDDDSKIINAAKVIQDLFKTGAMKPIDKEKRGGVSDPVLLEQNKDQEIKNMFDRLIRSASHSKDYLGFFLKEDFIQMGRNRYPEVGLRRLEILLDQVTTPHPPPGILQFNAPSDGGVKTYFIALEMIPVIFEKMNIHHARTSISLNMESQHFVLFLKKFFEQYSNSDVNRIAKLLHTNPDYVNYMKNIISKIV
jgi:hypothetical protein